MSTPGPGPHHVDSDDQQYDVIVPSTPPASRAQAAQWQQPSAPPPAWKSENPAGKPGLPAGVLWGIGGVVAAGLVVLLLLVTGVFSATDEEEPGANNQATGQYGPADPSGGNQKLRIVDKDSGISYDYLGEGWKDWSMGVMKENSTTVGEYIITQPKVPSGGNFIAQVTSGPLAATFGNPSPGGYAQTLAQVEESVRGNYYPAPNTPTNQAEGPVKVDGHEAYQRSMDLTWNIEGYDSTGERVVVLLIDTGKSAPIFFYCSFPNTHAELYPLIEQVIASIKVDQ